MKGKDLSSLLSLKVELKKQAEEKERLRLKEEKRKKERRAQQVFFEKEMSKLGVSKQTYAKNLANINLPKPAPLPLQTHKDNQAVLEDSLSDQIGIEHLLASDDRISYFQKGVAPNVPKLLHQGKWSIKGSLDLHGYTSDEAKQLLVLFLNEQRKAGHRAVRIIHGKGFGSVGRKPVLKEKVPVWLVQKKEVLAFVQAPEHDGGEGALLVLLSAP